MSGSEDLRRVLAAAGAAGAGDPRGQAVGPVLLIGRCGPTAAFSRRDTLRAGHAAAAATARRHGFEPVVRPVGGHLAAYDEGSLVMHLWAPHPDPRRDLHRRFEVVGLALAEAVGLAGVPDARVGPVPGEYCDGAWSVNTAGRAKLAGTGQRLFRRGYLVSAVISVAASTAAAALLLEAYADLGLDLDPTTIGAVADSVPAPQVDDLRELVAARVSRALGRSEAASRSSAVLVG